MINFQKFKNIFETKKSSFPGSCLKSFIRATFWNFQIGAVRAPDSRILKCLLRTKKIFYRHSNFSVFRHSVNAKKHFMQGSQKFILSFITRWHDPLAISHLEVIPGGRVAEVSRGLVQNWNFLALWKKPQ